MITNIKASEVIRQICEDTGYSRAHVANTLRKHALSLGADMTRGRWSIPKARVRQLRAIVRCESGPRYKKGETGPNRP